MYYRESARWLSDAPASANDPDPIEGICPPGLTLLYAQPNLGKSYLALSIAKAVVSGAEEVLGFPINRHTPVVYFALDDTAKTLKERIEGLGLSNFDNFLICDERDYRTAHEDMLLSGFDGSIVNFIVRDVAKEKRSTPGLIIVDTWEKIRTTNDHDYSSEVEELAPLKRMAEEIGYNVLLIHHANKYGASKSNKFADYYGSNGVAGETNVLMKLEETPSSDIQLLSVAGNSYTGVPELYLKREADGSYRICKDNEIDLTPDIPERDFSRIRKFMVLHAQAEKNKVYSYTGDFGQFCVSADLECSNTGLGKLLVKYRGAFEETGITYTTRLNHHRGKILEMTCDLRD